MLPRLTMVLPFFVFSFPSIISPKRTDTYWLSKVISYPIRVLAVHFIPCVPGAPEKIVELCSHYLDNHGKVS